MENRSRDSFLSNIKKNPKDYRAITFRSGREFQKRKEEENEITEKEYKIEAGKESEQNITDLTEEKRKYVVQQEQPIEEGKLQKREEVSVYVPLVPFP